MKDLIDKLKKRNKGLMTHHTGILDIRLFLLNSDPYGFTFSSLGFTIAVDITVDLVKKAQELESTITYLNEKITIVEIQDENRIIMKSDDPFKKDSAVLFYDMFLEKHANVVKVRFYRVKNENFKNSTIPSLFTYDQLERLISDLSHIFS